MNEEKRKDKRFLDAGRTSAFVPFSSFEAGDCLFWSGTFSSWKSDQAMSGTILTALHSTDRKVCDWALTLAWVHFHLSGNPKRRVLLLCLQLVLNKCALYEWTSLYPVWVPFSGILPSPLDFQPFSETSQAIFGSAIHWLPKPGSCSQRTYQGGADPDPASLSPAVYCSFFFAVGLSGDWARL